MAEPSDKFTDLLRERRVQARLTQQELADAAGLSLRTVSDLERAVAATPQKDTVRLLADALHLLGPARVRFETAARGRPSQVISQAAAAAAMRSLPRDVASFTGRQRDLEQLVKSAMTAGGVVGIHAIGGMAGVGKTAFAVHAAHQLAAQFSGGQIFLQLHGHTPGRAPVDPAAALASLLLTAGVSPRQIPRGLEERAALWRDRVAGKSLLLVLDDAASSEQVQPLLPGAGGALVLVTSRRHLSALDGATAISLDTLPPGEAGVLLVQLTGRAALSADDPGVRELIRLCGYLPLAIGMLARQLRHHPAWSAASRAAELAAARDRLGLMETENLSVAAAFDLSYSDLARDQQRLFRRIGLHPGTDIDGYTAAALDGIGVPAARRGLEALYDQCLLTEPAQGRYRPHDLIREHARTLAGRLDSEEDREAATARLLDYYQHTAAAANARIARRTHRSQDEASVAPTAVPALGDMAQALAWARAERASLLACLDYAVSTGQHTRVVALTAGLGGILLRDGHWADAVARQTAAVQAAQSLGDRAGQANALIDLGNARRLTGDKPAAVQAQQEALDIYRELGDRLGQANALSRLGELWNIGSDYPAAVLALEEALGMFRELGDRRGQARALNQIGDARRHTGHYPAAARALEEAFGLYRELGDRLDQANAQYDVAAVRYLTGDYPAAVQALDEALGIQRELGHRLGEANTLSRLGTVLRLRGDDPAAAQAQEQALGLYRDLGNRVGQARAFNERGTLHRVGGELARAEGCHQQSLELSRQTASFADEAHALAGLGRCALAAGHAGQAEAWLRQALDIYQRIGAAAAQELLAELAAFAPRPGTSTNERTG